MSSFIGRRLERFKIRIERGFDINHEVTAVRHVHDKVGSQHALLACNVLLLGEVTVLGHTGQFHQAPQRDFSPAAAHLGAAQRGHERSGFPLQLRMSADERFNLHAQACKRIAALMPVDAPDVQQSQNHVVFLENFFDELRRRVPAGK